MTTPLPTDVRGIAEEAFIFGYPLVVMDVTRRSMLTEPSAEPAELNRLRHRRAFPDASFTAVVSPNADTLYSTGIISLEAGPLVLHVPDSGGRYYLMPVLSAWTDVFASPGSRTTGNGEQGFVITGPTWSGDLPQGLTELRSPTSDVLLIGRTQTNGAADYAAVHAFQDGLALVPLSEWRSGSPHPGQEPQPLLPHDPTPPPDQVAAMGAGDFFGRLAALMIPNPPSAEDSPVLKRSSLIGLRPGSFEPEPDQLDEIEVGMRAGLARITDILAVSGPAEGGWAVSRNSGTYGTDYLRRAAVALFGLGANLSADSMYPHTREDSEGRMLDGAHRYVLAFPPGQAPPCQGFWSLTMYDEHQYFVDNPINRYAIGDRDPLEFGSDGSLEIWLQHDSPGARLEANWLPAPPGPFNVILRVYWPGEAMVRGEWMPPPIERLH